MSDFRDSSGQNPSEPGLTIAQFNQAKRWCLGGGGLPISVVETAGRMRIKFTGPDLRVGGVWEIYLLCTSYIPHTACIQCTISMPILHPAAPRGRYWVCPFKQCRMTKTLRFGFLWDNPRPQLELILQSSLLHVIFNLLADLWMVWQPHGSLVPPYVNNWKHTSVDPSTSLLVRFVGILDISVTQPVHMEIIGFDPTPSSAPVLPHFSQDLR